MSDPALARMHREPGLPFVVSAAPLVGRHGMRVTHRARCLATLADGVRLFAPGEAPEHFPGVRFQSLDVPPGASQDRCDQIVGDALVELIERYRPPLVHCFGVRPAVAALLAPQGWLAAVVEPGVTDSQRMRTEHPDLPAEQLIDLVALEDKALSRAAGVVVRSPVEAATMVQRGVDPDRVWTAYDWPDPDLDMPFEPGLPHLFAVHSGEPWEDPVLLLEAVARLKLPWRLTIAGPVPLDGALRRLRLENRVTQVGLDEDLAPRLASAQVVVSLLTETRPTHAGSVVSEAALIALASRRPLAAPDLPVIRAYAGGAAVYYEPNDPGSMADCLDRILGDAELRDQLAQEAEVRRQSFTPEKAAETLSDLWASLLDE